MNEFVTINGTDYTIDVNKAIENGCLKPRDRPKIGQIWCIKYVSGGRTCCNHYLLSQIPCIGVFLVNISTGVNWAEPVQVKDVCNISHDEWERIIGHGFCFDLLGKINTFKIDNNTFSASR